MQAAQTEKNPTEDSQAILSQVKPLRLKRRPTIC